MIKEEQSLSVVLKYPKKEFATVFRGESGVPFDTAIVGITFPFSEYDIYRGAESDISVFEYVLEGEGEVCIAGRMKRVAAGDSYILAAGREHRYRADPSNPWKKIWVNYRADYIVPLLRAYRIEECVFRGDTRTYFDAFAEISKSPCSDRNTCFRIADLIYKIVSAAAHSDLSAERGTDALFLRELLDSALYEKVNLDEVAQAAHLSKCSAIRIFKKEYGITPYEYLLRAKIETAKLLLKNTQMRVKEISDRLGIENEHYFSASFKERTGLSPRAYRAVVEAVSEIR